MVPHVNIAAEWTAEVGCMALRAPFEQYGRRVKDGPVHGKGLLVLHRLRGRGDMHRSLFDLKCCTMFSQKRGKLRTIGH